MNTITKLISKIFFIGIIVSVMACSKSPEVVPPVQYGNMYFHIHTNIDTAEADSGAVCKDATGRRFKLNIAQFYICGITVKNTSGLTSNATGVYLLKTIGTEEYYVASMPAGNYASVSFSVGIDATANSKTPSIYAAGNVLGTQNPVMWSGSTSLGYYFLNVQGFADTTSTNTGTVTSPISYLIGTNSLLRSAAIPISFSITANQNNLVHFIADYGKLLKGINFKTQSTCDLTTNTSVATQIANNIPNMFRSEY